jgi:hypothetical protein
MGNAFTPKLASATTAAPAGSSASASLASECPNVRLRWAPTDGSSAAQVRWGKGAQTAVAADMHLAAGAIEVFGKGDADTLAVLGTGTLYIVCGTGD